MMPLRELLSATDVQQRIEELACQIAADFADRCPVVIGILNGAAPFMMNLLSLMPSTLAEHLEYDFVDATSYSGSESTGRVQLSRELSVDIRGRSVLIVDGIVDTGCTLDAVLTALRREEPTEIHTCTLLDKAARRRFDVPVDYSGFAIDDLFVVGYGMDLDGRFRGLRHIAVVEPTRKDLE